MERFINTQPISCSTAKEEGIFHVAIYNESWTSLKYLTLEARPSQLVIWECGVHFCAFQFRKNPSTNNVLVSTIDKDSKDAIVHFYTMILSFKKDGIQFQKQFTLIYHDWDVLYS